MKYIAVFHTPCQDGILSAWTFQRYCETYGYEFELIPGDYTVADKLKDVEKFRDNKVFFIDYTISPEDTLRICEVAESVTILDHHKTAAEKFENVSHARLIKFFDMNRCGSMIAHWYFFPFEFCCEFYDYIQDYDLGRFTYPDISEFMAWFESYNCYTNTEGLFAALSAFTADKEECLSIGRTIQSYKNVLVATLVENAQHTTLCGTDVVKVNCPFPQLNTFVGVALIKKFNKPAWMWGEKSDVQTNSLRSKDNLADVSELAKQFGGGGHRNAAGFTGVGKA